jgi:hypothetical protein
VIRACEEFGYKPEEALKAIEKAPVGFIEGLIEMRTYANAYATYQRVDGDLAKLGSSKLMSLVREIHIEVSQQYVDEARAAEAEEGE